MRIPEPNFTQTPNDLFDHWLPHLSEGELKVLLVIMRKTFGWHKKRDRISNSQLAKITGLHEETVRICAKSLCEKGVIIRDVEGENGSQATYYEIVVYEENSNNNDRAESMGGPGGINPEVSSAPQKKPFRVSKTKETSAKKSPPPSLKKTEEKVEVEDEDFDTLEEVIKYMKGLDMMPFNPPSINAIRRKTDLRSVRYALMLYSQRSKDLSPLDLPDVWLQKRAIEKYEYDRPQREKEAKRSKELQDKICGGEECK